MLKSECFKYTDKKAEALDSANPQAMTLVNGINQLHKLTTALSTLIAKVEHSANCIDGNSKKENSPSTSAGAYSVSVDDGICGDVYFLCTYFESLLIELDRQCERLNFHTYIPEQK